MLDQVLSIFGVQPEFDLDLMRPNQHLSDLTSNVLIGMKNLFSKWKPDLVVVQGDTTTTFATSLAAFYEKLPVAHIEAGLRTFNKFSPWPEEINRCLTTSLASVHFPPTENARQNLLSEGIPAGSITVTGNTVIDALRQITERFQVDRLLVESCEKQFSFLSRNSRMILVTGHRRENFGDGFRRICVALKEIAQRKDVEIVYPVHLNPNVQGPVLEILADIRNVHLIAPQEYVAFTYLLQRCHLIITDSGGIQEEAPFLGKPVLLMRDTTERPEAVDAGTVKLVGTDVATIVSEANLLLDDYSSYDRMATAVNPFGDGFAAERVLGRLELLKGVEFAT
jgi:UDP-N-acetylglucosamine 2-epimerase (non-hydrolysing)